jgi:ubiquinone/menaquinone biosynthesis C-methylase UbiE
MRRSTHESSRGAVLSDAAWLDLHLEACRAEYLQMVGWVGFRPDWSVIDVGCGAGSFLPVLRQALPGGRLHGCDIDLQNARLAADRGLQSAAAASVTALPYRDAAFDAAWCANVVEFLSPAEVHAAACELRRVVRKGGLVALKDMDVQLLRIHPGDPHLTTRLSMATIAEPSTSRQAQGSLVGRQLRRRLEAAGLVDVVQRTWLIEHWAPLRAVQREFLTQWFQYLFELAERLALPAPDVEQWRRLAGGDLLDNPELYVSEGQVLAVGRVP